jgi:predicted nuclease of restriction endonuclease-like (RecB) superfamily
VVAGLARDLQSEFPGAAGFSAANLWRMKLFHETYGADEKLAPLVREIAWSHNVVILEKCKDPAEREFYIRATQHFGWTRNVLVHQIENRTKNVWLPDPDSKNRIHLPAALAMRFT